MLYSLLRCLAVQLITILAILAGLAAGIAIVQGADDGSRFLELTVHDLQGLWVWTFGWGLALFIRREGLGFGNSLVSLFEPSDALSTMVGMIEQSTSHRRALALTGPISAFGFLLTVSYSIPTDRWWRWLVVLGITSIYYVAAFILWHFLGVIRAFNVLYNEIEFVRFRAESNPVHLEAALNYLTITTTLGVAAIYAGFRGTLTAGFRFPTGALRTFLVTPLVLFLPATLLYNFHPRYVLRTILQHSLFAAMKRIREANPEDMRSLLLDIRDLGITNAQILPFMDYKSLPSYIIAILFVLSLAYHNDPTVRDFFVYLLGLNQR